MKALQGKSLAEALSGMATETLDLQPTNHVARRLARIADVPIDLYLAVLAVLRGVGEYGLHRRVARPTHRVQTSVGDEPGGPYRVGTEHAHALERRAVERHFVGE